jgi:hypothetical protein
MTGRSVPGRRRAEVFLSERLSINDYYGANDPHPRLDLTRVIARETRAKVDQDSSVWLRSTPARVPCQLHRRVT